MQVVCGHCGKAVRVDPTQLGPRAMCPHCNHPLPEPVRDDDAPEASLANQDGYAAVALSSRHGRILFACRHCGKRLAAPVSMADQMSACLGCGKQVRVPHLDVDQTLEVQPAGGLDVSASSEAEDEEAVPLTSDDDGFVTVPSVIPDIQAVPHTRHFGLVDFIICAAILATLGFIGAMSIDWSGDGDGLAQEPFDQAPLDQETRPIDGPETPPAPPEIVPDEPPVVVSAEPTLTVKGVQRSVFANAGYRPAAPDREYWFVIAEISGGTDGFSFRGYGPAVTLTVDGQTAEAMGVVTGRSVFPITGLQTRIFVEAKASYHVIFLFDLASTQSDRDLPTGRLNIARLGTAELEPPESPPLPETLNAGTYVELSPRNLQRAPDDPIVNAICQTPSQTLVITASNGSMALSLPACAISGELTGADDAGDVLLRHEDDTLAARVRMMDGGNRLVLYLTDEPYGQITFVRAELAEQYQWPDLPMYAVADEALPAWASDIKSVGEELQLPETIFQPVPIFQPAPGSPPRPPRRNPGGSIFD